MRMSDGIRFVCTRKSLSFARANLDWDKHLDEALDPETARNMYAEACAKSEMSQSPDSEDYCTMCGREWCSVRINKELKETKAKR